MVDADAHNGNYLGINDLEQWLWDAACAIRGATDAPKFSDVFDDEFAALIEQYRSEEVARTVVEEDHVDALSSNRPPIVRFYIPVEYSWGKISSLFWA